jgi:hypothetical protein
MLKKMIMLAAFSLMVSGTALAHEGEGKMEEASNPVENHAGPGGAKDDALQNPNQATDENWAYREISSLVQKYAPELKLPEGKSCTKADMARCLLGVIDKIVKTYEKEGNRSLLRDDLETISSLQAALEEDLNQQEGYRTLRGTLKEILTLVEPEVPSFEYMVGVNGFFRGEGARSLRLPDNSYTPGHDEGRFLYRVKPYAYWHPTDYLDLHLEGQGYGYAGGNQHSNKVSLYQGFLEAKIPEQNWVAVKAGRQEFVYGSAFVLGSDSAFDGLTYDGARVRLHPTDSVTLDLLGGRYAEPFSGGVSGNLAGGYLSYAPTEDGVLEAYAIRDTGSEEHHAGERLDILGVRATGKYGPLALEFEPIYQSGKLFNPATGTNDNIAAYGGHIDLSGEFEPAGFKNKFFTSFAIGSGDVNAPNKEFRNPNNDTSLVGDMHVVGDLSGIDVGDHHASGIQVYTLGWGIDLSDEWNFSATAHKFVAGSVEDGFSRHLGVEADFSVTYTISKDLSLVLAYDHFFTEKYFRDATGAGNDVSYGYAMLTYNFDKKKAKTPKI